MRLVRLLGVISSRRYEYVHYPWKENEFCHILVQAVVVVGSPGPSSETSEFAFFSESDLSPLSDGHAPRVALGFRALRDPFLSPFFEQPSF